MTARLLLALLLLAACRRDSTTLQGETDAKQVNVATKVSGRVDSLLVREGDSVRRGQIVATLDGPEIRAKAAQALAARDAARAIRDKARHRLPRGGHQGGAEQLAPRRSIGHHRGDDLRAAGPAPARGRCAGPEARRG